MAKLINNKLQTQRNFKSIWHNEPQYISQTLREDQLIRDYIEGTMKSQEWKISEIIIKRKVKSIHIAFQTQYKKLQERKRWTKNRLKNQIKYKNRLKLKKINQKNPKKKRLLFFQIFLLIVELRKIFPENQITFYIQRVQPLQFNTNLINSWIHSNFNKRKSYKRLINRIISKFRKGIKKINPRSKNLQLTWRGLDSENKKSLVSWVTANLIHLFHGYQSYSSINQEYVDQLSLSTKNTQLFNRYKRPIPQTPLLNKLWFRYGHLRKELKYPNSR